MLLADCPSAWDVNKGHGTTKSLQWRMKQGEFRLAGAVSGPEYDPFIGEVQCHAAVAIQCLWRGVRGRLYCKQLSKQRDEEEDEEDAREMNRVVVLKEAEVEWWEFRDDDRAEQDDVEVVEVAWRLHRERRSLRYLRYLFDICTIGANEMLWRQELKEQALVAACPIARNLVVMHEHHARINLQEEVRQFYCSTQLLSLQMKALAQYSWIVQEQVIARQQLKELFEGIDGLQLKWKKSCESLVKEWEADCIKLVLQEQEAMEQVLRKDLAAHCLATFELLYIETEEVKWRKRWSLREFCGRAALDRDIADAKYSWACAREQQQMMKKEQLGRNEVQEAEFNGHDELTQNWAVLMQSWEDYIERLKMARDESGCRNAIADGEGAGFTHLYELHHLQLQEAEARQQQVMKEVQAYHLQLTVELGGRHRAVGLNIVRQHVCFLALMYIQKEEAVARAKLQNSVPQTGNALLAELQLVERAGIVMTEQEERHGLWCQMRTQRIVLNEARARHLLLRVEDLECTDLQRSIVKMMATWLQSHLDEAEAQEDLLRGNIRLAERSEWTDMESECRILLRTVLGMDPKRLYLLEYGTQCSPCQSLVGTFNGTTFGNTFSDGGDDDPSEDTGRILGIGALGTFRIDPGLSSACGSISGVSVNGLLKYRKSTKGSTFSPGSTVQFDPNASVMSDLDSRLSESQLRRKKVRKKKKDPGTGGEDQLKDSGEESSPSSSFRKSKTWERETSLSPTTNRSVSVGASMNGLRSYPGAMSGIPGSPTSQPEWTVRASNTESPLPRTTSPLPFAQLQWIPKSLHTIDLSESITSQSPTPSFGAVFRSQFPSKSGSQASKSPPPSLFGRKSSISGSFCGEPRSPLSPQAGDIRDPFGSNRRASAGCSPIDELCQSARQNVEGWLGGVHSSPPRGMPLGNTCGTANQDQKVCSSPLADQRPPSLEFADVDAELMIGELSPRSRPMCGTLGSPNSGDSSHTFQDEPVLRTSMVGSIRRAPATQEKIMRVLSEYCAEDLKNNFDAHAEEIHKSKKKEREFFIREEQPTTDKPTTLPPIRWRDRWQKGAPRRTHQLQPLKKDSDDMVMGPVPKGKAPA